MISEKRIMLASQAGAEFAMQMFARYSNPQNRGEGFDWGEFEAMVRVRLVDSLGDMRRFGVDRTQMRLIADKEAARVVRKCLKEAGISGKKEEE